MTKKHFIKIANAIRETGQAKDFLPMILLLCKVFKGINPAFDDKRFLKACSDV